MKMASNNRLIQHRHQEHHRQRETQNLQSLLKLMMDQHHVSGCGLGESRNTYSDTSNNSGSGSRMNHWPTSTGISEAPLPIQGNMNVPRSIFDLTLIKMHPSSAWTLNSDSVGQGGEDFRSILLRPGQVGAGARAEAGADIPQVHRPGAGPSFMLGLGQTQGKPPGLRPAAAAALASRLVHEFQTSASSPLTPDKRSSLDAELLGGTPSNLSIFDLNRQKSSTTTNRDLASALIAQLCSIRASRLRLGITTDVSSPLNFDLRLSNQTQVLHMQHQDQLRAHQQLQQEFCQQQNNKEILKKILASLPTSTLIALAESTESFHSKSHFTHDSMETLNHNQQDSSRLPHSDSALRPNMEPRQYQNIQNRGEIHFEEGTENCEMDEEDESSWNANFTALCEFMIKNDLKIPSPYLGKSNEEIELNNWVELQKKRYLLFQEGHSRGLSITPRQIEKLESVGFQSIVTPAPSAPSKTRTEPSTQKTHVDLWNERYDELKAYKEKFGDCLVPERYEKNHRLGTWVRTQRKHYKLMRNGKISSMKSERIERLNSIGFAWTVK
mmetsp:Transcript_19996/g.41045  ORF Transcript_19996/g.41045 Transcript_19996/m.41045 type:complete len:554 (+) Transcript_19996:74-1735(+)